MTVFMEYLRKKFGWCPSAAVTGTVRRQYPAPAGEIGLEAAKGSSREVIEGVFVDYTSPRFLPVSILVFGGLFVAGLLIPSLRSVFLILTGLSFIAYAAVHLYPDTKRAEIESFRDAIVVRRSRSRPLVFGKDAFRSIEVKGPYPPILPLDVCAAPSSPGCGGILRQGVGWVDTLFGQPVCRSRFHLSHLL